MWNVTETLNNGAQGTFGPFDTYRDALKFLLTTEYPWTSENIKTVSIDKEST